MNADDDVCDIHASTCVCNGLCAAVGLNKRRFPFGVNTGRELALTRNFLPYRVSI
jgi:hypothetical protein